MIAMRNTRVHCQSGTDKAFIKHNSITFVCLFVKLVPGFYSYTEGATWKILDLLTETLLI